MTATEAQEMASYFESMPEVASVSVGSKRDGTYTVLVTYKDGHQQEIN